MSSETPAVDEQLEETASEVKAAEDSSTEEMTIEIMTKEVKKVHPYEDKLSSFKPNEWQLKKRIPRPVAVLEDDTFTFVDSITSLEEMMTELKMVKELGISVLYDKFTHFHSTCSLLPISTRTHDYLVDVIKLRDELKVLNEVFTDESVLKVCYSVANKLKPNEERQQLSDLNILASTLGLWVVNFFELGRAGIMAKLPDCRQRFSQMLRTSFFVGMPSLGENNNWAVRPLSEVQLKFARMRSHYLLYIQDVYRNKLIDRGCIDQLYDQCTNSCKSTISKAADYGMGSHIHLYRSNVKKSGELNHQQLECYRLLFKWRYETAKKKDKGIENVLWTTDMFNLAKRLPTEIEGVAKCFNGGVLPPLVESDIQVVHRLILQAINDVTDLSIVEFDKNSLIKRSSTSKKSNSTAKRSRRDFRGSQLGRGVMMGRGGFHNGSSATGPMRGRGGFQRDHSEEGPILPPPLGRGGSQLGRGVMMGRGGFHSGSSATGPMRGRGGFQRDHLEEGPILPPPMGRGGPQLGGMGLYMGHQMGPNGSEMGPIGSGMGSGMGSGYGQVMGPGLGYQMDSFGQGMDPHGGVSPGFISQIVEEVVGQMTMRGMSYGSKMSGMNNQGYGISRGGRGHAWR